jgi:hypothetical protein
LVHTRFPLDCWLADADPTDFLPLARGVMTRQLASTTD